MEFARTRIDIAATTRPSLYPILLVSLVIHLVLGLLVYKLNSKTKLAKSPDDIKAIQAQLVFYPPPPKLTEALIIDSEASIEVTPELPIEIDEVVEIVEDPLKESNIDNIPEPTPAEQEVVETELDKVAETSETQLPTLSMPQADQLATEDTPSIMQGPKLTSMDLAKQHLENYSTQANQEFVQRQAQQYRKSRISPNLPAANVDPFETEDEKFQKELAIKADCSSTTNKTLVTILSFAGSTIKCNDNPGIDSYIDKHVKKPIKPSSQTEPDY
ncbi:hypothetical protein [Aliiglaciecola sp. LCG003]|uniref:hypothetical protein n=1 Tax=Aliiglaciecola sp. LCG003 TaxID=3053655 RepID=UPI002572CDD1|nr:hypothetical protein [Aliiglaciecola sp. LCG003]WJG09978.1 hypothetical protein QR722_02775 [Aliiglaciecola sp. LCG003]